MSTAERFGDCRRIGFVLTSVGMAGVVQNSSHQPADSGSAPASPRSQRILFVTGRLAEASLREVVTPLAERLGFTFEIAVPGVQVAALLHTSLLLRRLDVPADINRVILPGWVQGDLPELQQKFGRPFERGPKDLRDLPVYFGEGDRQPPDLSQYSTEIIAEINHATRQPVTAVVAEARALAGSGADRIDVGCVPGESSPRVGEIVSALRQEGLAVSIDSFDPREVEQAVDQGATLILSANRSNVEWVTAFGVEVVAIPDTPQDAGSLRHTVEKLEAAGTPFRMDPILEPVGMGFTESLHRYFSARREYPDVPMMMGIGNVTELAEVDSAGVNLILAAVCEELAIQSVLTTQVINWCRTAVAEFDAARRLVRFAVRNRVIAKHLDSSLAILRDPRVMPFSDEALSRMAGALTDASFRIFSTPSSVHLMNRHGHWTGTDVFRMFADALRTCGDTVDAGHAFYLGYELARAELARHLGKQYNQDEPLRWGLLGESAASSSVHHPGLSGRTPDADDTGQ